MLCHVISITSCRAPAHLISLLLVVALFGLVFYVPLLHPSPGLVVIVNTSPNTVPRSPDLKQGASHTHKPPSHTVHLSSSPLTTPSDSVHANTAFTKTVVKQGPSHTHKPDHSDDFSLATLLTGLKFNNYGVVKSTDQFLMKDIPCWYSVVLIILLGIRIRNNASRMRT